MMTPSFARLPQATSNLDPQPPADAISNDKISAFSWSYTPFTNRPQPAIAAQQSQQAVA